MMFYVHRSHNYGLLGTGEIGRGGNEGHFFKLFFSPPCSLRSEHDF